MTLWARWSQKQRCPTRTPPPSSCVVCPQFPKLSSRVRDLTGGFQPACPHPIPCVLGVSNVSFAIVMYLSCVPRCLETVTPAIPVLKAFQLGLQSPSGKCSRPQRKDFNQGAPPSVQGIKAKPRHEAPLTF